jgi:hypothetical protein
MREAASIARIMNWKKMNQFSFLFRVALGTCSCAEYFPNDTCRACQPQENLQNIQQGCVSA